MKILTCCSVFVLLTLISFPITADAFSRRHSSSELEQNHFQSVPHNSQNQTLDISPQAVPEPPVLLLMGIGMGLFAVYSGIRHFRGQKADRE
jgi:hypothetical protein